MISILPADSYIVISKGIISDSDRKILTMLYQPVIGDTAVSLYFTLIDDFERLKNTKNYFNHYHLMSLMMLKLDDILVARKKLEAIGLLKTFFREDHVNNYVYELFNPISPTEFINHPILGVILYNNLGDAEYQNVISYFRVPHYNLKEFKDISSRFDDVFTSIPGSSITEDDAITGRENGSITLNSHIDINLLINSIPKNMISDNAFNNDIKDLINKLAYTYNLDDLTMQGIVRDSINERGLIDKSELRKRARNYYQFDNHGKLPTLVYTTQPEYLRSPKGDSSNWAKMVYTFETVTPYDYLKSKNGGIEPSSRDLKLIEDLLVDYQLPPGVVNVLISYVLKINNQKLNRAYVETIASQWKRLKIQTVEDAMNLSEKEHKKMKKKLSSIKPIKEYKSREKQLESTPDWFDEKLDVKATSKEEQKEMDDILNSL